MERRRASVKRQRYAPHMTRSGMTSALAGFGTAAAFTLAVLLGAAVPGIGRAQILKCEIRTLQPNDERRLVASARASFPSGLEAFVTHPCRNGSSALAGVVTEHVKESNGVLHWWGTLLQARFRRLEV